MTSATALTWPASSAGNGSASDQRGAFRTFKGVAPNVNILDLRVSGSERRQQRQRGDRGPREGRRAEEQVQRARDQSLARPADV